MAFRREQVHTLLQQYQTEPMFKRWLRVAAMVEQNEIVLLLGERLERHIITNLRKVIAAVSTEIVKELQKE